MVPMYALMVQSGSDTDRVHPEWFPVVPGWSILMLCVVRLDTIRKDAGPARTHPPSSHYAMHSGGIQYQWLRTLGMIPTE